VCCTVFLRRCRFYDVEAGQVLLGGQDLKQLQLASLRQAMAIVPQVGRVKAGHRGKAVSSNALG
jgi:ABC-type transport system involved in Fe-S cluster assembly fused permease/ATPase subunit